MEARIVLAAAVIDDVLGMLVLSIVVGSAQGSINVWHLAIVLAQVVAFVGFELLLAPRLVKRHAHWLDRLKIPNAGLVVALLVMLAMAALAESIGLAGIVGAFFAGMMFAETEDRWELAKQARPLYEWLVPYFFVVTGMQVQASLFSSPGVLVPGLALVAIAVATKVVGCGIGAWGMGWRRMVAVGIGMVPRGEVGLIVASTGLAMKVIGPQSYAMIMLVVVVSTVVGAADSRSRVPVGDAFARRVGRSWSCSPKRRWWRSTRPCDARDAVRCERAADRQCRPRALVSVSVLRGTSPRSQ